MMATHIPTDFTTQKEDSAVVLQFFDGKQRVTVRALPGYTRTMSDMVLGAANDPSQKPHTCIIRATIKYEKRP
jgi:hypothetical protein